MDLLRGIPRFLGICLLAVALAGGAWGLFFAGKATTLLVLVGIFAMIGLSLFRDLEYLAFLAIAASLPIRLNMRVTDPVDYSRAHSAGGFVISLTDCLIVVLIIAWMRRTVFFNQPFRWKPAISIPLTMLFAWVVQAGLRAEADVVSGVRMILRYVEGWALLLYLVNNIRPIKDYIAHALTTSGMLVFEGLLGMGQGATGGFNFGMEMLGAPMKRSVEHSGSRITGTLPTPNFFASLLSIGIAQPLAVFFSRNKVNKYLVFGVILLTGMTMLGTKSRGVWLSSTLIFGYFLFALLRSRFSTFRSVFGVFWLAIVIGGLALASPGVLERLTADDKGSTEARLYMAQIAGNMIEAKPWFGFGWDNYTLYFNSYDDTDIMHSEAFPFIVHNGYLYVAAEYGLPALLLIVWVWLYVLRKTFRFRIEEFTFPAMAAFLMPWVMLARAIQAPLYVNNPLTSTEAWYALGLCLVYRELADQDRERRKLGLPDPLTGKP